MPRSDCQLQESLASIECIIRVKAWGVGYAQDDVILHKPEGNFSLNATCML